MLFVQSRLKVVLRSRLVHDLCVAKVPEVSSMVSYPAKILGIGKSDKW